MNDRPSGPRCAALVGPYLSGKTTLLEALLFAAGATTRRGTQKDGNTVGDHTPEARARQMSTEINAAHATFLGDPLVLPRLPRLGRARLGSAMRHARRRRRGGGVRARARTRADLGADLQVPRRQFHPAHGVHQQARHRVGAGERGAGGAAIRVGAPAGAAPGAASGRGECDRRVCRSGERALPTDTGPGQASDLIKLPEDLADEEKQSPRRPAREARRFRRQAAGTAARGRAALEGRDLPPSDAEFAARHARAGVFGRGPARSRRPPPVEGAPPRDARRRHDGRALGPQPGEQGHRRQRHQDLFPAAYRQAVAGAGMVAAR